MAAFDYTSTSLSVCGNPAATWQPNPTVSTSLPKSAGRRGTHATCKADGTFQPFCERTTRGGRSNALWIDCPGCCRRQESWGFRHPGFLGVPGAVGRLRSAFWVGRNVPAVLKADDTCRPIRRPRNGRWCDFPGGPHPPVPGRGRRIPELATDSRFPTPNPTLRL
jgi:hypothetical protein